jgi:hypothetical protein
MRTTLLTLLCALLPTAAHAFCGFYVGKSDQPLYNKASQVALVRDGDRTVMTLSNDYEGDLTEFAMVVPVPSVLTREQIHIGDRKLVDHLDQYSLPRIVEYYDPDPCPRYDRRALAEEAMPSAASGGMASPAPMKMKAARDYGVTIEATYTIGEYDIVLLSATQSGGLADWLKDNGYKLPPASERALRPYIKQDMKFFVAKVNLKEQKAAGFTYLRPIQIAFESPRFGLPIRLGMANAKGPQDLLVYAITRQGRVEVTNYKTLPMPTGMNVPTFIKDDFKKFYQAAFDHQVDAQDHRAVFTEYSWPTQGCDPCSAAPLSPQELRQLGAFWIDPNQGWGQSHLTRLHIRYDDEHFPEDLAFQVTSDQTPYQARYVMQVPFKGDTSCEQGHRYMEQLRQRHTEEAKTLASLTGWSSKYIHGKMSPDAPAPDRAWYEKLWQ